MRLSDLYPANTPMREVHPDFRGMTPDAWRLAKIAEQAQERAKLPPPVNNRKWLDADYPSIKRPGFGKGNVATARDGYGI
jgi:hypothetical protein